MSNTNTTIRTTLVDHCRFVSYENEKMSTRLANEVLETSKRFPTLNPNLVDKNKVWVESQINLDAVIVDNGKLNSCKIYVKSYIKKMLQ